MIFQKYVRTDLAAESAVIENKQELNGIEVEEQTLDFGKALNIKIISDEGKELLGKDIGTYVTISFDNILNMSNDTTNKISHYLSETIKRLTNSTPPPSTVLVAGLGNRYITPDAIGPLSVKGITVTRHIEALDKQLFTSLKMQNLSAISPGVIGQTGIETFEIIKGAVNNVNPDLLIVIDALASKSVDRLASTIQVCDTGISPGSGIGNNNKEINKNSVGIPVIAIGVPTMVSSSTLVCDALEKAGINDINDDLVKVLENGRSFFVTLNESDVVVNLLADIISNAINLAFTIE